MRVLVTGGAGFIGSHIADALLAEGHTVLVLDSLHPQVHKTGKVPGYLSKKAEFVRGDVRNPNILKSLIQKVDAIFHEASLVGVGQSMYQVREYVDTNVRGTAELLDVLVNTRHRIKKLVVASSMSIYGEGAYVHASGAASNGRLTSGAGRSLEDLKKGRYELPGLRPIPTPETKAIEPTSIYAQTKRDQEEMCLLIGKTYGIPAVALRYFNVYGPRQSLDNPYTGVLAIFGTRLLNNRPPLVFEDGRQTRDFVHVRDVAAANVAALESDKADGMAVNIGTGRATSVIQVAKDLARALGKPIEPKILNEYRDGDIRHCVADIQKARTLLGWTPQVRWEDGLTELAGRLAGVKSADGVENALGELAKHKLRHKSMVGKK